MAFFSRLFARHYDRFMRSIEERSLAARRRELLAGVEPPVLEIGAGTGANSTHYPKGMDPVLLEPDSSMAEVLRRKEWPVKMIRGFGEALPFPSASFATIVSTLVLCSVEDLEESLAELRRVLRPGGRLLFLEHVRADSRRGRIQDLVQPAWSCLGQGCRPNRRTVQDLTRAGFEVRGLDYFDPLAGANPLVRWLGQVVVPFVAGKAVRPDVGPPRPK